MTATYQRLNAGEIAIGQPVPWALFDENRKLLLARGVVLESERQLVALMERGLFRVLQTSSTTARTGDDAPPQSSTEDVRQLEDIRLGIGDSLQMQSRAAGDNSRHYVKLIGFLKGKAVIVSTPVVDGHVLLMREGQTFVVRLFSGKSAFAFAAGVLRVANVPFPHLYLDYPKEVRGLVVRRGARAKVQIIAAINGTDGRSHAGTIVDLSIGGAQMFAKSPLGDRNSTIALKFRVQIHEVEQYITLSAIIRSIRAEATPDGEGTRYQHGIQFLEMPTGEQVALSGFVYQTLFEQSSEL